MSATLFDSTLASSRTPAERSALVRWSGRLVTGIVVLFIVLDTGVKLLGAKGAVDATVQIGYQPHHVFAIGIVELACLIVYLIPRTSVIAGAVDGIPRRGGGVERAARQPAVFAHVVSRLLRGVVVGRAVRSRLSSETDLFRD